MRIIDNIKNLFSGDRRTVTVKSIGKKVRIDYLIADIIETLNRKGYITVGCCSGHKYNSTDGIMTGFIKLADGYFFEGKIENNRYFSESNFDMGYIEWNVSGYNVEERKEAINILRSFVNNLPDFEYKGIKPNYYCITFNSKEHPDRESYMIRGFSRESALKSFYYKYEDYEIDYIEIVPMNSTSIYSYLINSFSKSYRKMR